MNIAFPALIIFLLLLPGLIFRKVYYSQEDVHADYTPFATKTVNAVIISILFNCIWLTISNLFFYKVDFFSLLSILTSQNDGQFKTAATNISENILPIFIYFLSMYLAAVLLAAGLRYCIKKFKWDRYKIFRIYNQWYYLFEGYTHPDMMNIIGSVIAASVTIGSKSYLYVGILSGYDLDSEGNLKTIMIKKAYRRNLFDDKNKNLCDECNFEERFYKIDGDYLILEYQKITTLNIAFVKVKQKKKK